MTKKSSLMSKFMVLLLAFAVVFTYSVMPMNQAYAASAKKPAKVTIKTAKAASASSVKVTWKKAKNAKKYQVYASTKKSSGFKKVATTSKTAVVVKKLKAGTKYYVQVRAYKKRGHKKAYGKWSKKKSVTTYYSIKYVLNGGTQASGQRKSYTKSSKTFSLKAPARKGYVFVGWYTTSSYKTKVARIKKGTTGNKTFYAKWTVADEPVATEPYLSAYLRATTSCQVGATAIKNITDSLTAGITTDAAKAKAIFNYVRDQIDYEEYKDTRYGALGTLNRKSGNPADQAHLLIAMLRTAGIPARYHYGQCTFNNGMKTDHVWVEYSFDETTWHALDPTSSRNTFDSITNWDTGSYVNIGTYASLSF